MIANPDLAPWDPIRAAAISFLAALAGALFIVYVVRGRRARAMRLGGVSAISLIIAAIGAELDRFGQSDLSWWFAFIWLALLFGFLAIIVAWKDRRLVSKKRR